MSRLYDFRGMGAEGFQTGQHGLGINCDLHAPQRDAECAETIAGCRKRLVGSSWAIPLTCEPSSTHKLGKLKVGHAADALTHRHHRFSLRNRQYLVKVGGHLVERVASICPPGGISDEFLDRHPTSITRNLRTAGLVQT